MLGSKFFGGRWVCIGRLGHIAGVVNPDKMSTNTDRAKTDQRQFREMVVEGQGTCGPGGGRIGWLKARDPTEVPAREPGGGLLAPTRTRREAM
jgi:poly(3-hydroxyalkanoate) synthetase